MPRAISHGLPTLQPTHWPPTLQRSHWPRPIQFHREGHLVAQAVTDANGHFVAHKLTGGVYTVQTLGNVEHYRVWTNEAAPPSALNDLNISGGEIVRGQYDYDDVPSGRWGILAHPWLIGLGVAAAIAIPLALDNDSAS